MPPKSKPDATPATPPTPDAAPSEEPTPTGPPAHASELCPLCGQTELHPSATSFVCEHGSWTF